MSASNTRNSLAELARSTQQNRDAALLRATTDLFAHDLSHDEDEIHRYEELATHFLPKVGTGDRVFVAERLAACPDAPQSVVRMLARDVIEAAAPVIEHSSRLTALDFLAVIAATSVEHHRLIAHRADLADQVKRALRLTGDEQVIALLDEGTAPAARGDDGGAPSPGPPPSDAPAPEPLRPAATKVRDADRGREEFLRHDRATRLRVLADLATRPPAKRYAGSADRLDRAFRAILNAAKIVGYARTGQQGALITAIAEGLDLEPSFVAAGLSDATGEPLAIMLKALRLDDAQAQQVFLLASAPGREGATFFPLADLYSGMEPEVAESLCDTWRLAGQAGGEAQHQPHLAEDVPRRRAADKQRSGDAAPKPTEQARRA